VQLPVEVHRLCFNFLNVFTLVVPSSQRATIGIKDTRLMYEHYFACGSHNPSTGYVTECRVPIDGAKCQGSGCCSPCHRC
jgi:hypothetical protein